MKKKQILASTIMLSLLQGSVYADGGVITTAHPAPGWYDSINRVVTINDENQNDDSEEGLEINTFGDYEIVNGGNIKLVKDNVAAYGIHVIEGKNKEGENIATNLTIGGKITVYVDNTASDSKDKTFGVWKEAGYNAIPEGEKPEAKGGKITLNNADITVKGNKYALGLIAGDDFGNNSSSDANDSSSVVKILVNGDISVNTSTQKEGEASYGDMQRTIGALAHSGIIELNGNTNTFTVNGASDGNNYGEIAGFYTSKGGSITSGSNSNVTINVSGEKIYGISSGYYDCVYEDERGLSNVNLQGQTVINLGADYKGKSTNVGVAAYAQSENYIKDLTINFMNLDEYCSNTGLNTQAKGQIDVDSLYIGTAKNSVQDPTKILAVSTDIKTFFGETYENSGVVNINQNGVGTVKVIGELKAVGDGTINIDLTNQASYLYGHTLLNNDDNDNGEINLAITDGAKWINVQDENDKDSRLTTLTLKDNGLVDLTDKTYSDGNFQNIYIEDEFNGGNGTINMDIDASTNTNNSDRIYVNGIHKGTHYITLNPLDENKLDGAAGTVLVSVKDEQGEFKAKDSEGALYWNKYTLDRFDTSAGDEVTADYNTDWYLKEVEQLDEPTTSVDTILGAYALGYHTWRAETDKLMKRMGDLRHNGEDEKGAWFRVRGAEISRDGEASFENKYTVYELGYDEITKKTDRFTRYQGAALSYIDGTSSFARGSGENNGKSIAFYTTEMRNKGHYLDLVFRIADMDSDYKVYDTNGNKITGEPENIGVSLSAEYGRKKVMDDNGWYIEPQGQLTLGYFGGDNYRAKYADQYIDVHQSGIPSVLGRVGFNIGRDIDENTNIYLKANLLHEFCGDYDVDMVDSAGNRRTESDTFNDTWFEYGIGAAIKTGKNNHIYFDFEKTAGGDFEQDWAWNAGMRWTF